MKTIYLFLAAFTQALILHAQDTVQPSKTYSIEVKMENLRNDEGAALIALYTNDGFMGSNPLLSGKTLIKNGTSSYVFENVPPGTYAIVALHDINGNHRMDFDDTGMPQEAWATSNNEMSMGPPDFNAAKFILDGEDLNFTLRF